MDQDSTSPAIAHGPRDDIATLLFVGAVCGFLLIVFASDFGSQFITKGVDATQSQITTVEAWAQDPAMCPYLAEALSNSSLEYAFTSELTMGQLIDAVQLFHARDAELPPALVHLAAEPYAAQCANVATQLSAARQQA